MTYTFTIISPKFGSFVVTAPARFREEIEAHVWHVQFHPSRAVGGQFDVTTNITHPAGGRWPGKGRRTTTLTLHRFVWRLAGRPPTKMIDHRDRQPLNCSEENLRAATPAQNSQNQGMPRSNTSGVLGVCWNRLRGKWMAQIKDGNRAVYLGLFSDIDEARRVRDAAALTLRGEFAVLNGDVQQEARR